MNYYNSLIPENAACPLSRNIKILSNAGNCIGQIPLYSMIPNKGKFLYRFMLLSDVHCVYNTGDHDTARALHYANDDPLIEFVVISGDIGDTGTESEFEKFIEIRNTHCPNKPVFLAAGNHEHYLSTSNSYFEDMLGHPLYYSYQHNQDLFIFLGVVSQTDESYFADGELQWLYETLEANRDKRVFLLEHYPMHDGSGDPLLFYGGTSLKSTNEAKIFKSLLEHYKNVVFFHGHTHMKFEMQEYSEYANYDHVRGIHSIHVPSVTVPRMEGENFSGCETYVDGSAGYIVDVHSDGIYLQGRNLVDMKWVPLGTYWLDTTTQDVPPNTYNDPTGTLMCVLDYRLHSNGTNYIVDGLVNTDASGKVAPVSSIDKVPVVELNENAFKGATNITSAIIPDSIKMICDSAFSGCTSLEEITFEGVPSSTFADNTFSGCTSLSTIRFPYRNSLLVDILDTAPWGCPVDRPRFEIGGVIYRKHTSNTSRYVADGVTSDFKGGLIELVDSIGGVVVYEINSSAYKGVTTVTGLIIPASVKAIEANICNGCTNLQDVIFRGAPSSIPSTAFANCPNLETIYVPWSEGDIANAPWGATSATIIYDCEEA